MHADFLMVSMQYHENCLNGIVATNPFYQKKYNREMHLILLLILHEKQMHSQAARFRILIITRPTASLITVARLEASTWS